MTAVAAPAIAVRPLQPSDLDAVVAIDQAIEGRPRRAYVQRRLDAALREPARHVQFAAVDAEGELAGYLLARHLLGEFGRARSGLRIEMVGVRRERQQQGVGRSLLQALADYAARKGVVELRSAARWNQHEMLRWFDAMGFELAPDRIVDCAVAGGAYRPERDAAAVGEAASRGDPNDYSVPAANDYERLARDGADLRSMTEADLPAIVRIDRLLTGRDRGEYMRAQFAETLADSAIRVSLVARLDDTVVGYLMARTDLGDFGRTEPVAIIDTIGVDPEYAHRGVGRALLSQLMVNLGALRVERVETILSPRDLALLGFLTDCGFLPSQRLAFVRRLH